MTIWTGVMISLLFISLGIGLAEHGEPKGNNFSFWWSLFTVVIWLLFFWYHGLLGV